MMTTMKKVSRSSTSRQRERERERSVSGMNICITFRLTRGITISEKRSPKSSEVPLNVEGIQTPLFHSLQRHSQNVSRQPNLLTLYSLLSCTSFAHPILSPSNRICVPYTFHHFLKLSLIPRFLPHPPSGITTGFSFLLLIIKGLIRQCFSKYTSYSVQPLLNHFPSPTFAIVFNREKCKDFSFW